MIADNDTDFSKGLKEILDRQEDIKVVGIVRDGQGAVDSCREELPDLVLMDLHLPVLDSIKAVQRIIAHNERIRILTTSSIPNDQYAIEAIKAGACGYVEKNDEAEYETMAKTVRQVAAGEVSLNPALAASILEEFRKLTE